MIFFLLGVIHFVSASELTDFCMKPFKSVCTTPLMVPIIPGGLKRTHVQTMDAQIEALLPDLKRSFFQVIDQAPELLTQDVKSTMKKNIEDTKHLSAEAILYGNPSQEVKETFLKTCGSTGLRVDAVAFTVNSERVILVCPGSYLFYGSAQGMGRMLAHELSHSIDIRNFDTLFYDYLYCLDQMKPVEYPKHAWNGSSPMTISFTTLRGKKVEIDVNLMAHAPEITADYWATQVIQSRFKEKEMTLEIAYPWIKRSFSRLCTHEGDLFHPPGWFRLHFLFARDAGLRSTLGCSVGEPMQGCSL